MSKRTTDYFAEVEKTKEHNGYFYNVAEVLTVVIVGSLCGLRNINQIHQWATHERTKMFLSEHLGITDIPCYYWFLCLLKIIKPESLSDCFMKWVRSMIPDGVGGLTLSFDGKTIRSTEKMKKYESPLHIVSAHIADMGITFGQYTVQDKTNEIPAMRELLGILEISGCMVVADALNCQKETALAIKRGKADYLLNVKDNQPALKEDIEGYIQDEVLRKTMDSVSVCEKNRERIERRSAYTSSDITWLSSREAREGLSCIGAINTKVSSGEKQSDEWHYYISSRPLRAEELLKHARMEWSVESMHWLLDVHFGEDFCRIQDEDIQQSLNIVRKIALNSVKAYKEKTGSKRPLSKIMFDGLLDPVNLLPILSLFHES
jgi:predicted transposase YbfD/YdcC